MSKLFYHAAIDDVQASGIEQAELSGLLDAFQSTIKRPTSV